MAVDVREAVTTCLLLRSFREVVVGRPGRAARQRTANRRNDSVNRPWRGGPRGPLA